MGSITNLRVVYRNRDQFDGVLILVREWRVAMKLDIRIRIEYDIDI